MCTKFHTVAASNNRVHAPRSLYYYLFALHIYIVVLRAHPVRGESHNQCNATREVATSPPFYQQATTEITLLLLVRATHILLFFMHIPFMVNHTINATPLERLQQYDTLSS